MSGSVQAAGIRECRKAARICVGGVSAASVLLHAVGGPFRSSASPFRSTLDSSGDANKFYSLPETCMVGHEFVSGGIYGRAKG